MSSGSSGSIPLTDTDFLYRGINDEYFMHGQVLSGAFILKKKDKEGLSVGIAKLIPLEAFKSLMEPSWGVARLTVSEVKTFRLTVQPLRDDSWGQYADAHAVMTNFQSWTNKEREDAGRNLAKLATERLVVTPTSK